MCSFERKSENYYNETEDMSYHYKDCTTDKLLNDHCYGKIKESKTA